MTSLSFEKRMKVCARHQQMMTNEQVSRPRSHKDDDDDDENKKLKKIPFFFII
jgi:hypothetical protein